MGIKMFLIAFFCTSSLFSQLPLDLELVLTNKETYELKPNEGKILFDIIDGTVDVKKEDAGGNWVTWKTCSLSEIESFKLTGGENDRLLLTTTNIYHALQNYVSVKDITAEYQSNVLTLKLFSGAQTISDMSQIRSIVIENIGSESSIQDDDVPDTTINFSDGVLHIDGEEAIGEIQIHSLSGKLISTYNTPFAQFEEKVDLPKGIYFVKLKTTVKKILR